MKYPKKKIRQLVCLLCAVILLSGGLYTASWFAAKTRIEEQSEEYSRLYYSAPYPTIQSSDVPQPAAEPVLPEVADVPIPTPNDGTLVYALPTPPPVQSDFSGLMAINDETIGFLRIGDVLSLPVVQRENDNEYYLRHNFEHMQADEGALFLDGMNRLVPEDDCLIVYGHNMHNGTMFGPLDRFDEADFLAEHPLVQFNTIYHDRLYVPIAAFPASMNPESGSYFDVRQFLFDPETFDLFVSRLKNRSVLDIPIDAYYGDRLLLLVTCDYTKDDGRFIVALRQLRAAETEAEVIAQIVKVQPR